MVPPKPSKVLVHSALRRRQQEDRSQCGVRSWAKQEAAGGGKTRRKGNSLPAMSPGSSLLQQDRTQKSVSVDCVLHPASRLAPGPAQDSLFQRFLKEASSRSREAPRSRRRRSGGQGGDLVTSPHTVHSHTQFFPAPGNTDTAGQWC